MDNEDKEKARYAAYFNSLIELPSLQWYYKVETLSGYTRTASYRQKSKSTFRT